MTDGPRRGAEAEGKMHRTVRLAVVGLLAFAAPVSAQDAGAQQSSQVPAIVTSGEATVRRAPDVAFVSIGVETRARTPREAQQLNADAMSAVQYPKVEAHDGYVVKGMGDGVHAAFARAADAVRAATEAQAAIRDLEGIRARMALNAA